MIKFNDGGPAFPHPDERHRGYYLDPERLVPQTGMTLWDYYAAAALQGILARLGCWNDADIREAATAADAMLKERQRRYEGETK